MQHINAGCMLNSVLHVQNQAVARQLLPHCGHTKLMLSIDLQMLPRWSLQMFRPELAPGRPGGWRSTGGKRAITLYKSVKDEI